MQDAGDGCTVRAHLLKAWEVSGNRPAELEAEPLDGYLAWVWQVFLALSRRRGSTGFSPSPLSWREIEAWERINSVKLEPFETDAVCMLDDLFLSFSAERAKRGR